MRRPQAAVDRFLKADIAVIAWDGMLHTRGTMPMMQSPAVQPVHAAFGYGLDWSHAHPAAPINQYASSMYPAYAGMAYTPPLPMYVYGPYGGNAAWVPAAAAAVTMQHMPVPQPDEDAASNTRKRYLHRPAYVYELALLMH